MNIFACIATRDTSPSVNIYQALERAGRYAFDQKIATGTANQASNPYSVACARNIGVSRMLASDATHLFFLDDDVLLQEDAIALLAQVDADIVLGCYPSFRGSSRGIRIYSPYVCVMQNGEWLRGWFDGVREVDGGGTGCMLIRREVLERLGHPWFVWREVLRDTLGIEQVSDDMDFCKRARAEGFTIKAHGNVRCGHMKHVDVASFVFHESQPSVNVTWCGTRTLAQQRSWPEYGSHVPALISIGQACEVRSVIEYGSGRYSTPVFLNRRFYPDVERLVSFETDPTWFHETMKMKDDRLKLELRELHELSSEATEDADVVFIDCDDQIAPGVHDFRERVRLLEKHASSRGIVVMHDANFPQIFGAVDAASFTFKQMYQPLCGPHTAIMSNTVDVTAIQWRDVPLMNLSG